MFYGGRGDSCNHSFDACISFSKRQEAADVKSPSVASDDDVFSDSLREIARLSIAFNDLSQVKISFIIIPFQVYEQA